ncbi:DEAD/DEAH box helicase [Colwellia sp. MB3u-70]|uniref:DEAD/DEAH box helicase n=1 Tax=unclassified Colwellia TaxID=196834 RepID=UPI0015F4F974|nr:MULTISPECIES: DEAD/DEAH box helicase [unclassified Colwellia]MBA6293122.1 DEAD/DEAH box helicase [Colwellia sp. MB3u-8]MBA6307106.1 DEAD/DEAH box helicase [Colwellia sp. MB3u-70]
MLTTNVDEQKIIVTGNTAELLRLKAQLTALIPSEEIIINRAKGLMFPRKYLSVTSSLLADNSTPINTQSKTVLEDRKALIKKHLGARTNILKIIENAQSLVNDSHWDNILMPYQGVAVNCIIEPDLLGICIFDEQGTGKTLTAVAAYDILFKRGFCEKLIVVSPLSLLGVWEKEFKDFIPGQYSTVKVEGNQKNKFDALNKAADVYLINYESVSNFQTFISSLAKSAKTLLVVDESFLVKNPDAKRSQSLEEVRKECSLGVVLCGTPAPNNPTDIIHQFNIADGGMTFSNYQHSGKDQRANIEQALANKGVFLRRLKSDVLSELPDKNYKIEQVTLTGRQLQLYQNARNELYIALKNIDNSDFKRHLTWYFQRRSALLQICVNPSLIDPLFTETPAKHAVLDGLIKKIVNQGKKVIVWSTFTADLLCIEKRYTKYGVVRVDGSVSGHDRSKCVERFQNEPDIRIFVANPAAAGAGLTLHAADTCIYLSYSNQAAHYMQSLDRIHRKGQLSDSVEYIFLVCDDTIEINELKRLQNKESAQRDLLGDADDTQFTLQQAIEEVEQL